MKHLCSLTVWLESTTKLAIRPLPTFLVPGLNPVFCLGQAGPPIPTSLDELNWLAWLNGQDMARVSPPFRPGFGPAHSDRANLACWLQFHWNFYSMATVNLAFWPGFDPRLSSPGRLGSRHKRLIRSKLN